MLETSLCVPAQLKRKGGQARWFRLAVEISMDGIALRSAVPQELWEGPVEVELLVPPPAQGPAAQSTAQDAAERAQLFTFVAEAELPEEEDDAERAAPSFLRFVDLDKDQGERLYKYLLSR